MKMEKILSSVLVLCFLATFATATTSTQAGEAVSAICEILFNITWLLNMITAGVGTIVIVMQGIKWTGSAEDPGARKQAKQGIIHAVVGMIIVILAIWIVQIVFGSNCGQGGNWEF